MKNLKTALIWCKITKKLEYTQQFVVFLKLFY